MESYKNLGGDSGVTSYEITLDSIKVEFLDSSMYLYTYSSAGAASINCMKQLAVAGEGLNSFINRVVRNRYAKKIR